MRPLLDDAQIATLIIRTAEGDRAAFRLLYDHAGGWLLAITLRILRRRDLAEEAMQDAFVSVWKTADGFSTARGSALGWLATIARRRAIDRLRASPWLARECAEADGADMAETQTALTRLPERLALRQCLEKLDLATRQAICLAYLYGLTHAELSRKTGVPLGTMKSRLRRGLQSLKECLER